MNKVWIVEDEKIIRITLADDLRDAGYDVLDFDTPAKMLKELEKNTPSIVITDMKMPGMDGIELLTKTKEKNPDIEVIVMTAFGTIKNAVKAMQLGASNYITKPFSKEEMLLLINNSTKVIALKNENKYLRKHLKDDYDFSSYIGNTQSTKKMFELIKLVAQKDSTVLITGETGTGKELISNIIHFNSSRRDNPMVKVSCAILSKDIFESELFGHVKGAFTGADSDKKGRFELADGGTLYLDDIDDIPLPLQVKLLRAIEEREIERVGSAKTIPVDVRIIASTKKDLLELVKEGKFREDLFYRLNVFPIKLNPLRERKEDILEILKFYLEKYSGDKSISISPDAADLICSYGWPGNVRELRNIAERMVLMARDNCIDRSTLPDELLEISSREKIFTFGGKSLDQTLRDVEISAIQTAMKKTNFKVGEAAKLLGLPISTLSSKIKKLDIK